MRTGLSQRKAAKILGVSDRMLCFWEAGERIPNIEDFIALCQFYHVAPEWVLGLSTGPYYDELHEENIKLKEENIKLKKIVAVWIGGLEDEPTD